MATLPDDPARHPGSSPPALLAQAPVALAEVDPTGRFLYVNDRCCALTGHDRDALIGGLRLPDLAHPDDRPTSAARLRHLVAVGSPADTEERLIRADGAVLWVALSLAPVRDEGGALRSAAVALVDVSARRQATADADRHRLLAEQSGDAMLIFRADGRIVDANRAACDLYGYRREELLALRLHDIRAEETLAALPEQLRRAERGPFRFETIHRGKDGAHIPVEASWSHVEVGGERVILSTIRDITERTEAERRLADIVEQLPIGVSVLDRDGRALLGNSAVRRFVPGTMPSRDPGRIGRWQAWGADGAPLPPDAWPGERALRGERVDPGVEFLFTGDDGRAVWTSISTAPLRGPDGAVAGVIAAVQDIDARKRAEAALRESEARFRRLYESDLLGVLFWDEAGAITDANDAFLAMVGHSRAELAAGRLDWGAMTPPEYAHLDRRALADLRATGRMDPFEKEYIRRDGSRVPILIGGALLEGTRHAGVAFVLDNTARKRAEAALREGAGRLRAVLHALPVAVWLTDATGAVLLDNPAGARIWGEAPPGREHRGRYRGWRAESGEPLTPEGWSLARTLATGEAIVGEVLDIAAVDGTRRTILSSTAPLLDEAGVPQGAVVVNEDITALRQAERELRASEARLRLAVEANRMVAWEWDPAADRITTTDNFAAIYGLPALAGVAEGFALVWPEDLPAHREKVELALREGGEYRSEFRITRPADGRTVWLEEHAAALTDAAGRVARVVGVTSDITERARAEAALRASQRELQQLADAMPQVVWIADPRGAVTYYNRRVAQFATLGEHGDGTWDWRPVLHPDDVGPTVRAWELAAREHAPYAHEHRIRMADGGYRWHLSRAVPVLDAGGALARWYGTATDIHELKQAEADTRFRLALTEQLRRAEEPAALLGEVAALVGAYLAVDRCFFFAVDEASGLGTVAGVYHREGVPPVADTFRHDAYSPLTSAELAAGRTVVVGDAREDPRTVAWYETTYGPAGERAFVGVPLWRDGRWRATLAATDASPRAWEPREVALLQSVAERTWLTVEKLRLDAALRDREAQLAAFFNAATIGVAVLTPAARFLQVNEAFCGIVGYGREELAALDWAALAHPDDRAPTRERLAGLIAGHLPAFALERRCRRKDGATIWVQDSVSLTRDAAGRPLHLVALCQDITARVRAEEDRQALLDALAHDLKNPLTAIKGQAQVLQRRLRQGASPDPTRLADHIAGFERLAARMAALLDGLREGVGDDAGEAGQIARRPVALAALVRECAEEARRAGAPHAIRVIAGGADVTGEWDPALLGRVIANLLDNAIKYSPAGGAVTAEVERAGEGAVLRVRDEGIGIPAADLPHIFAPRRRGGNVGAIAGSGVGLASCQRIVEAHGGTIAAASAEGRGTTITVRLPLAPAE